MNKDINLSDLIVEQECLIINGIRINIRSMNLEEIAIFFVAFKLEIPEIQKALGNGDYLELARLFPNIIAYCALAGMGQVSGAYPTLKIEKIKAIALVDQIAIFSEVVRLTMPDGKKLLLILESLNKTLSKISESTKQK